MKIILYFTMLLLVSCDKAPQKQEEPQKKDISTYEELAKGAEIAPQIKTKVPVLTDQQIDELIKILLVIKIPKTVAYIEVNNLQWMLCYLYMCEDSSEFDFYTYEGHAIRLYQSQISDYLFENKPVGKLTFIEIKSLIDLDVFVKESPESTKELYPLIFSFHKYDQVYEYFLKKCMSCPERQRLDILLNFTYILPHQVPPIIKSFSKEIEEVVNVFEEPYTDYMLVDKLIILTCFKKHGVAIRSDVVKKTLDSFDDDDVFIRNIQSYVNSEYDAGVDDKDDFLKWFQEFPKK